MTFNLFAMGFRSGQKSAYEDAARIVEKYFDQGWGRGEDLETAMNEIRARAKEMLK